MKRRNGPEKRAIPSAIVRELCYTRAAEILSLKAELEEGGRLVNGQYRISSPASFTSTFMLGFFFCTFNGDICRYGGMGECEGFAIG